MVFASRLWLGSRHCSLGIFRDRAILPVEESLFWIEIALMVGFSVRFARGASKLRSFLSLVSTRTPIPKETECQLISDDLQARKQEGPP
jgi:hypothetical protein